MRKNNLNNILVILLSVITLAVLIDYFFLNNLEEMICAKTDKKIKEKKEKIDEIAAFLKMRPQINNNHIMVAKRLEMINKKLIPTMDINSARSELRQFLTQCAEKAGILLSIRPISNRPEPNMMYSIVHVDVTTTCNIRELKKFIHNVESNPKYYIEINDWDYTIHSNNETINCKFTFFAYMKQPDFVETEQ